MFLKLIDGNQWAYVTNSKFSTVSRQKAMALASVFTAVSKQAPSRPPNGR